MLNGLEKEELAFFEKDYYLEIEGFSKKNEDKKSLNYFEKDTAGRFRAFYYSDKTFKLNADPIIGYQVTFPGKDRNIHSWVGIYSYGYFSDNIGVSMDFRSNNEHGTNIDGEKDFTPETGIIPVGSDNIDYTEVKSMVSIDWGWGNAVVAKDFIEYGYAKSGNLVLSNKAPSFPYIRLQLNPVDWLNFYYFHAFLSSNVIDSAKLAEYKRDIYINKYFAWHSLIVTPLKGLDISVGESVVYGSKLELVYLMPFLFYYYADDFLSDREGKPGDANSQIFLSVSSRNHLKNTHFYGTFFIDELTLRGISGTLFVDTGTIEGAFTDEESRTQVGYTVGLSAVDMPYDNLTLTAEYTRINPFVYGHHDPAQTYTNSSYLMGHWMGHNSDLIYLEINYRFLRGLQATLWGEYIRKGSSDHSEQYGDHQPAFLFGLKNYYKYLGLNLKYEFMHDLNFEARFRLNMISSEQEDGSFEDSHVNEFSFLVYYGL
ncbi:MAG: hypothetical protein A2330_00885 [Ignavibacteria bacterium RIFOXYB2_FULL_36_7]|nr:MAG: hypothetical protein A2330_00885 [Ignavibacteria bacterium RIFOXYB2_FULL_36_7]